MSMMTRNHGSHENGNSSYVLIVDDDVATRRLYSFLLNNGGYAVVEAEDGVEALEKLGQVPCSLVITDMNMPRMDGMDLIRAIRRDYPSLQVILITAFGTPETEKQARKLGANDYLAKPFDFEELEQRVHRLIQKERAVDLA